MASDPRFASDQRQVVPKRFIKAAIDELEEEGATDALLEGAWICRRPLNRTLKRTWDAKSAARAVCVAIKNGHSKSEIDREVQRKCNVGQPACDCEKAELLVRQILTITAAVGIVILLARFSQALLPVILNVVILRLLPRAISRQLTGIREAVRALPDQSRVIEGVFTRIRQEASIIFPR